MRRLQRKPLDDDSEIGSDPYRDAPRKASRPEVNGRLNGVALALNAAHEQLAALRHELAVETRPAPKRRKAGTE